jgi:hypothetical protein
MTAHQGRTWNGRCQTHGRVHARHREHWLVSRSSVQLSDVRCLKMAVAWEED